MSRFSVDSLQEMYMRVERKLKTKEEVADFFGVSVGAINNYLYAKRKYDEEHEVCAQNVSVKVFTAWALKYGGKGEPKYKNDPHPGRKHVKKSPEQIGFEDVIEPVSNDNHIENLAAKVCEVGSELSAEDRKEIAKYMIDSHYFFMKILMVVI